MARERLLPGSEGHNGGRGGWGVKGRRDGREPGRAQTFGLAPPTTGDWSRLAAQFGVLQIKPEQIRAFSQMPGSDEEPWDVLLSVLALDEHTALARLAERTGLRLEHEPR